MMKLNLIISMLIANFAVSYGLYVPGYDLHYLNTGVAEAVQKVLSLNLFPNYDDKVDSSDTTEQSEYEKWLVTQGNTSFQGILNNIGGISEFLEGTEVSEGAVIASPSKNKPNYFYQWVRDAALTIRSLVHYLEDNNTNNQKICSIIEKYIENNYYLQRLPNNSGRFDDNTRSGLGEPKFMPDCTAFDEHWGRPQNDGPGLRISTIVSYLNLIEKYRLSLSNKFLKDERFIYDEIIKPDLFYIVKNWKKESFDIWEEVNSIHFFTSMSQLRAVIDGLKLAKKYEVDKQFVDQLYESITNLKSFIEVDARFAIPSSLYIIETPGLFSSGKRSGLDAAALLASIHSHDLEVDEYSDVPFDVNDYHILNTINAMASDMRFRYPINRDRIGKPSLGVALGRYPEDIYDGVGSSEGNPWFIATASAAEVIFKTVYKLSDSQQDLLINKYNQEFFKSFINFEADDLEEFVIPCNSIRYNNALLNLFDFGDSFLKIIKDHVDGNGHMSEQFNKYTGYMQGAMDLTWSYSAFWNALRWRNKTLEVISNHNNNHN
ncbi:DEHA2A12254p [Debaryomyces hansenii CBS767]|uniref:glucan 1,4-alpha-glucosidase n=1 Tax=Debaryomyces hansenii (strain ATCC 36239 / CBS 767 / BCRC 21394 / JCM 1990 / NBRC 0083 / IGC 2968) TaxID=284592 RepID=B5RSV0_DEBHA|nr:DEHA2A12254p [Debaryomyces hansenii CBS767]CAR65406.1 DEHA2A12254p [Debaryomyces hansenii CBS767]|eukprot:XP_002770029.1 DEHA2A12254p [Debaryomyces hansenii CBS767]